MEFTNVGLLVVVSALAACSASENPPGNGGSGGAGTSQGGGTQVGVGGSLVPRGGSTGSGGTSSSLGGASGSLGGAGNALGGSANGGGPVGGAPPGAGGAPVAGGASLGGAGNATGGATTGSGGSPNGTTPPGYWVFKDWHGCVWTGVDTVTVAPDKSVIMPTDFTAQPGTSGPYHVTGSVGKNAKFEGTALLGFNLGQPAEGANCTYNPASATAKGPPEVAFPSGPTGIAVNFSKSGSTGVVRIQLQGENGATDANNRWCYTLTQTQGKDFAPFNRFFTKCWADDGTGKAKPSEDIGKQYNGEKISAVVFNVPGNDAKNLPFDFTVNGFALGTSAADAPEGGMQGSLMGTIGGADVNGATNADYQRVKVSAGGKSYVIQNNNWGNATATEQTITYKDNSFTITGVTGPDPGGGSVRSFPSIYIGGSGNTQAGAYSTYTDDNLPKKVSAIQSVQTTFKWSGGTPGGNYNVSYDVWFAADQPAASFPFYPEYKDGKSGFIMVWLYKPGANNPIGGTPAVSGRSIPGVSGTWNVYAGPRGGGSNAPVISYVATSTLQSMNFDLNAFIKDSVQQGAGGFKIGADWYLTDVFGGFEVWNGNDSRNLKMDEFTAIVK